MAVLATGNCLHCNRNVGRNHTIPCQWSGTVTPAQTVEQLCLVNPFQCWVFLTPDSPGRCNNLQCPRRLSNRDQTFAAATSTGDSTDWRIRNRPSNHVLIRSVTLLVNHSANRGLLSCVWEGELEAPVRNHFTSRGFTVTGEHITSVLIPGVSSPYNPHTVLRRRWRIAWGTVPPPPPTFTVGVAEIQIDTTSMSRSFTVGGTATGVITIDTWTPALPSGITASISVVGNTATMTFTDSRPLGSEAVNYSGMVVLSRQGVSALPPLGVSIILNPIITFQVLTNSITANATIMSPVIVVGGTATGPITMSNWNPALPSGITAHVAISGLVVTVVFVDSRPIGAPNVNYSGTASLTREGITASPSLGVNIMLDALTTFELLTESILINVSNMARNITVGGTATGAITLVTWIPALPVNVSASISVTGNTGTLTFTDTRPAGSAAVNYSGSVTLSRQGIVASAPLDVDIDLAEVASFDLLTSSISINTGNMSSVVVVSGTATGTITLSNWSPALPSGVTVSIIVSEDNVNIIFVDNRPTPSAAVSWTGTVMLNRSGIQAGPLDISITLPQLFTWTIDTDEIEWHPNPIRPPSVNLIVTRISETEFDTQMTFGSGTPAGRYSGNLILRSRGVMKRVPFGVDYDPPPISSDTPHIHPIIESKYELSGLVGFEGTYAIDLDSDLLTTIFVMLKSPCALAQALDREARTKKNCRDRKNMLQPTPSETVKAKKAHQEFRQLLIEGGIDDKCQYIESHYFSINGEYITLPCNMVENISKLPCVAYVYPFMSAIVDNVVDRDIVERTVNSATPFSIANSVFADPTRMAPNARSQFGLESIWSEIDGSGVNVAVVDTGIDPTHPEFARFIVNGNIPGYQWHPVNPPLPPGGVLPGINSWVPGINSQIEPLNGMDHGTPTTGAVISMAPNINLVGAFNGLLSMSGGVVDRPGLSMIGAWEIAAADANADIIISSIGYRHIHSPLNPVSVVITNLVLSGRSCVSSAGNSGSGAGGSTVWSSVTAPVSPLMINLAAAHTSASDAVCASGWLSILDTIMAYSSRGPVGITHQIKPDITATVNTWAPDVNNQYRVFGGTSNASPILGGLAALLMQKYPTATPWEIKSRLMNTCRRLLGTQFFTQSAFTIGAGHVDIRRALDELYFVTVDQLIPVTVSPTFGWEIHPAASASFGLVTGTASSIIRIRGHD